jgi:hypothetical protein
MRLEIYIYKTHLEKNKNLKLAIYKAEIMLHTFELFLFSNASESHFCFVNRATLLQISESV